MHQTSTDYPIRPLTLTLSPAGEREKQRGWRAAVLALLVLSNGLVLFNAIRHDPAIGYDAEHHLRYVRTLADGKLPTRGNSREFFSPPAPYLVPAAVTRALSQLPVDSAAWYGAKSGQLVNAMASVGLTLALLQLCRLARPGDARFEALALLALAMLPVYYKSFAFLRGEPLLACFATLATVQFLRILGGDVRGQRAVILGILLGLCILARQWGFFLFPALALAVLVTWRTRTPQANGQIVKCAAISGVVALLVGGWFYGLLWARYSTVFAFNRDPAPGNLFATQPMSFYTSLRPRELFTSPARGAFPNRLLPILYSETWGDYWGYFVGNRGSDYGISRYLGRVNLVSLVPTALLLAGGAYGLWRLARRGSSSQVHAHTLPATCGAILICSFIGYGWFLLRYPDRSGDGDTIKATYILHVFPPLAILGASVLLHLPRRARQTCIVLLLVVMAHNAPAMITRYGGSPPASSITSPAPPSPGRT